MMSSSWKNKFHVLVQGLFYTTFLYTESTRWVSSVKLWNAMLGLEFKIQTSNGNHKGKLKGDRKDL